MWLMFLYVCGFVYGYELIDICEFIETLDLSFGS